MIYQTLIRNNLRPFRNYDEPALDDYGSDEYYDEEEFDDFVD